MKKIKIAMAIIAVTAFMLTIKSCKKVDNNGTVNAKEAEASKATAIKAIKEKYGNISAGIVFNVNKAADEYFYKDAAGKMVSLYNNNPTSASGPSGGNAPSPCKANCNTTSNPADLRIIYTLDYVQRFYICESGTDRSTLAVKWTVSVPFQLGYTVGNVPPLTYGKVQVKNSGGTVINTFQAVNGQVSETMIGADPSCPTWNNLWEITYSFTNVTNGNFASGNTIEAAISLENDCSLVGYVVASGFVSAPAFSQNAYLPCNRIDKVWTYPGVVPAVALGNRLGISCTPPTGFLNIDYHQLEYRQVTSSTSFKWEDQDQTGTSTVYWGIPSGASSTSPIFDPFQSISMPQITSGSGWWLIRYRNVKTGSCNTIYNPNGQSNGNWGNNALWITDAYQY